MLMFNDNDGKGKSRNSWGKVVKLDNPEDIRGWGVDNFSQVDIEGDAVDIMYRGYRRRLFARASEGDSNVPKRLNGAAPRVFMALLCKGLVTAYPVNPVTEGEGDDAVMLRTSDDGKGNTYARVTVNTDKPVVGFRVSVLRQAFKVCKVKGAPRVGDGMATFLVGWEAPDGEGKGGGFHVDSIVPLDAMGTFLGNTGLAVSSKSANLGAGLLIPGANDKLRQDDLAHVVGQSVKWEKVDSDVRDTLKVTDALVTVVWGRQQLPPERYQLATHVAADRIALGAADVAKGQGMDATKARGVLHLAGKGQRPCTETEAVAASMVDDQSNVEPLTVSDENPGGTAPEAAAG